MLRVNLELKNPKYCNGCKWIRSPKYCPTCDFFDDVKLWKELVNGTLSGKIHRPKKCTDKDRR